MVEMLLCVLILLLSTGVTVSTLDLGIRHFKARTRETEQRLLCNTLSLAVQEYLTYAYDIETGADGKLTKFKTGAISVLNGRPCQFVNGHSYYAQNDLKFSVSGAELPELAVKYSKDGTKYYPLADYSQYIAKRDGKNISVKLKAALEVKVDKTNKRFNVTITVTNADGDTSAAKNEFIVIPINPNAIKNP